MATYDENLCWIQTTDGVRCGLCSETTEGETIVGLAADGTPIGPYVRDPEKLPKLPQGDE